MIITAFLNLVFYFVVSTVGFLPSVDALPSGFNDAVTSVFSVMSSWNVVIPIFNDLFSIITLMLTIETGILTLIGINWVIKKFTFSG